jgi:hypothetical protein
MGSGVGVIKIRYIHMWEITIKKVIQIFQNNWKTSERKWVLCEGRAAVASSYWLVFILLDYYFLLEEITSSI